MEQLDSQITTRIPTRVRNELQEVARERGTNAHNLARTLLDEAIRRERHPGITFRAGPAGRRACVEGRRLDVWQVVETVRASGGDVESAAGYLRLRPEQVRSAVGYYAEYPAEIDSWILANHEEANRLEASWKRQQAVLGEE